MIYKGAEKDMEKKKNLTKGHRIQWKYFSKKGNPRIKIIPTKVFSETQMSKKIKLSYAFFLIRSNIKTIKMKKRMKKDPNPSGKLSEGNRFARKEIFNPGQEIIFKGVCLHKSNRIDLYSDQK